MKEDTGKMGIGGWVELAYAAGLVLALIGAIAIPIGASNFFAAKEARTVHDVWMLCWLLLLGWGFPTCLLIGLDHARCFRVLVRYIKRWRNLKNVSLR